MGIVQPVSIVQIVRSLSDNGSTGSSKLNPSKLLAVITGAQDFQSTINNDGSLWFWPGGGPGTFQCELAFIDNGRVDNVQVQFTSRASGAADVTGWSIWDGSSWNIDNTTYDIADGTLGSPSVQLSNVISLTNPVNSTGHFNFHVVQNNGVLTPSKTFGTVYLPNEVFYANFNPGTYLNSFPANNVGISPFMDRMFLKLSNTYARVIIDMFGDSTIAEVMPIAAADNTRKDGIWHKFNDYTITNTLPIRIYSRGQGAATWSEIQARVRANLSAMATTTDIVGVQVWTWNSAWGNVGEATTAWAEWLVLKAEIEAAGKIAVPVILHPYTTRNSTGEVEAFNYLKTMVAANNGIDLSNITGSTSYPNLVGSESEDNIHMNQNGATRCGPAIVSTISNFVGQYYNI